MTFAAERTYELRTPAGTEAVHLRIGRPEPDPAPGGSWRCLVHVTGPAPLAAERYAYGEDSLQALVLALEMARVGLRFARLPAGAALSWFGAPDLGIPRQLPGAPE